MDDQVGKIDEWTQLFAEAVRGGDVRALETLAAYAPTAELRKQAEDALAFLKNLVVEVADVPKP